jgi:hypothetical protein
MDENPPVKGACLIVSQPLDRCAGRHMIDWCLEIVFADYAENVQKNQQEVDIFAEIPVFFWGQVGFDP